MVAVARGSWASAPKSTSIPIFLAPAFAPLASTVVASSSRSFATTTRREVYYHKSGETNKKRGVSAIRRTGPKVTKGLWAYPLPEPVSRTREPKQTDYEGTQDHGLWGFFNKNRQAIIPPAQESSHGRGWTYQELSLKDFKDLHSLYWRCILEQNQILTRSKEALRVRAGFGGSETTQKIREVRITMKNIREVLVDRQLGFEEAWTLLQNQSVTDVFRAEDDAEAEREQLVFEEDEDEVKSQNSFQPGDSRVPEKLQTSTGQSAVVP